jgi:FAD/FMN-containing dehydrogenase
MKTSPSCPKFDKDASTCLYIKDETFGEPVEPLMELWFERISVALEKTPHLLEEAIIGVTQKDKEKIHGLRHQIPTAILETTDKYEKDGGGKISGDWWVPKDKMLETVLKVYEEVDPLKIDFTTYGHLGDGHPHSTFLCRTPDEKALAHDVVTAQARRAVSLGGGVAGEHGIGKIKHDLLSIQYTPEAISKMRRIKDSFDPKWLLGKGNIFASKSKS